MAKARKITRTRLVLNPGFAELVVWEVPEPVSGSPHSYKYRLAYVVNGVCRVRYDNERGKGDHRHLDGKESPIRFVAWSGCWRIFGATSINGDRACGRLSWASRHKAT